METEEKVDAGIALLNEKVPDWRSKLTKPVVLSSKVECVLGQVYGHYDDGLDELAPDISGYVDRQMWAADHGFTEWSPQGSGWSVLQSVWNDRLGIEPLAA